MANYPDDDDRNKKLLAKTIYIILAMAIICFLLAVLLHGSCQLSSSKFPKLEIDSITVSNFNLSNPSITSHWNISMNITNLHSSDLSFNFSRNFISIFYESQEHALWEKKLAPFDTNLNMPIVHLNLDFWGSLDNADDMTRKAIGENIAKNGTVSFDVRFKGLSKIEFKQRRRQNWWWKNDTYFTFSCEVLLFFESLEKTRAYMLINDSRVCKLVEAF